MKKNAISKPKRVAFTQWLISTLQWFDTKPRPAQLLLLAGSVVLFSLAIDASYGWKVWNQLFHPNISTVADVRFWSALVYGLAFGLGLPVAFLLWHWRDRNVRDQIENSLRDINLKEFHEVQKHACGLFDDKIPESARQQLQIASLHQLRGFLRGEYGDSFRRPAFELLLAGHAEAMNRIGARVMREKIAAAKQKLSRSEIEEVREVLHSRIDPVMWERIGIIRDEAVAIFDSGFPLNGRDFDFCILKNHHFPKKVNLSDSSFTFSNMTGTHLIGADLRKSWMQGANLRSSKMDGAKLSWAKLDGACLRMANLRGNADLSNAQLNHADLRWAKLTMANLRWARLEFADLRWAKCENSRLSAAHLENANLGGTHLMGADLRWAHLEDVDLQKAIFDDQTQLIVPSNSTEVSIPTTIKWAQDRLRRQGACHVNDPIEGG